jgi:putative RecB family exonuclease
MTALDERSPTPAPATAPAVLGSLSPSRGGDFKSCPLKYRFRVVDRLPERRSPAATRGTVVHAVLEALFDLPAAERTLERASAMVEPAWRALLAAEPELAELFDAAPPEAEAEWLDSATALVAAYFRIEDPARIEPAERELPVGHELPEAGVLLRGIVDRIDVGADGALYVTDYKTGSAPGPAFEEQALFQMKFYGLLLWRTRGLIPRAMRLVYLGDGRQVTYRPDEGNLLRFERMLVALWQAIRTATERGDWRPRPSKLCDWCDFQALCPEFGGTPPPLPEPALP